MKRIINTSTFLLVSLLMGVSQPPLTSDIRKVGVVDINPQSYGKAQQFIPAIPFTFSEFRTNERPIVVEVTVSSNVVFGSIYIDNGVRLTNYLVMSSNIISVTTNTVK